MTSKEKVRAIITRSDITGDGLIQTILKDFIPKSEVLDWVECINCSCQTRTYYTHIKTEINQEEQGIKVWNKRSGNAPRPKTVSVL